VRYVKEHGVSFHIAGILFGISRERVRQKWRALYGDEVPPTIVSSHERSEAKDRCVRLLMERDPASMSVASDILMDRGIIHTGIIESMQDIRDPHVFLGEGRLLDLKVTVDGETKHYWAMLKPGDLGFGPHRFTVTNRAPPIRQEQLDEGKTRIVPISNDAWQVQQHNGGTIRTLPTREEARRFALEYEREHTTQYPKQQFHPVPHGIFAVETHVASEDDEDEVRSWIDKWWR